MKPQKISPKHKDGSSVPWARKTRSSGSCDAATPAAFRSSMKGSFRLGGATALKFTVGWRTTHTPYYTHTHTHNRRVCYTTLDLLSQEIYAANWLQTCPQTSPSDLVKSAHSTDTWNHRNTHRSSQAVSLQSQPTTQHTVTSPSPEVQTKHSLNLHCM